MMKPIARWRQKVWNRRLIARQHQLHTAIALGDHDAEMAAERSVNEALVKKAHWKRRCRR